MKVQQGELYTAAKVVHEISLNNTLSSIVNGQIPETKEEVFENEGDDEEEKDEEDGRIFPLID